MDWKQLVIICSIIVLTSRCCIPGIQSKYYTTEFGSERPKKNNFKFAKNPYQLKTDDILETDVVYIKTETYSVKSAVSKENNLKKSNSFLRFFSDGKCIYGSTENEFENAINDYNNLKKGIVGYYKIESNKLIMEDFLVTPHDCGSYKISSINIVSGELEGYKKLKVEGLTGTPDW